MTPAEHRTIRESAGMSQAQLADLLGLNSRQFISHIERGGYIDHRQALLMRLIEMGEIELIKRAKEMEE